MWEVFRGVQLGGAEGSKHSTDSYNSNPNKKRLPGINIRGNGVSSGRGINIHSAGNWAYSTGCILPVPKELISRNKIGGSMSNLPPNWQSDIGKSYSQVVFIIDQLKVNSSLIKVEGKTFNCAKLIITENTPLVEEYISIVKNKHKVDIVR